MNPHDGKYYAFVSRPQLLGSISSALRYSVFDRAITELFTRVFGIPLISHFDDFGSLAPPPLIRAALTASRKFCALLLFILNGEKTEVGDSVAFLGILVFFPPPCAQGGDYPYD